MGDPIEVDALASCFQRPLAPLFLGSVKTNVGHSEAVSGISSIIKVTLGLEHRLIPPSVGVQQLNPKLKLQERNFSVVTKMTPWPILEDGSLSRASVRDTDPELARVSD